MSRLKMKNLTPHDQLEIRLFQDFLRAVGIVPGSPNATPEDARKIKAWVEADPEPRLKYLGLRREWARENGYDV